MDIVNEYMKNNRATDWFGVKRLHCNDGFSMSVQAHYGAYYSPRTDPTDTGYYFEVEVGFPSEREELLDKKFMASKKGFDQWLEYAEKNGWIK